ncbi:MAG: hypothetical protein GQ555_05690 [Desulfobacterales bacterium]|nr:hypothetical protein [Desulfobacterales bacterium]
MIFGLFMAVIDLKYKIRVCYAPVPVPDPQYKRTHPIPKGEVPSPINPPPGCRFHPRCASVKSMCSIHEPELVEVCSGHWVACFE